MGWRCPTCNLDVPQKRVLNADLQPASKPDDGVIIELACGHTLGTAELQGYRTAILAINTEHATKVAELERERKKMINDAWTKLKGEFSGT